MDSEKELQNCYKTISKIASTRSKKIAAGEKSVAEFAVRVGASRSQAMQYADVFSTDVYNRNMSRLIAARDDLADLMEDDPFDEVYRDEMDKIKSQIAGQYGVRSMKSSSMS